MEDILLGRRKKLNEEINIAKSQLKINLKNIEPIDYIKPIMSEVKKKYLVSTFSDRLVNIISQLNTNISRPYNETFLIRLKSFLGSLKTL